MSILIGSNKANKMFWGSTAVSKVYWGDTKVWPSTKPRIIIPEWDGENYSSNMMYYVDSATVPTSGMWTKVRHTGLGTKNIDDIAFGKGLFVAVGVSSQSGGGNTSYVFYSRNGLDWTQATVPTLSTTNGKNLRRVVFGNGVFLAAAEQGGEFLYSTDGINWSKKTAPASGYYTQLGFGNGKFICALSGLRTDGVYYSTNGINWTACTVDQTESHYLGNGQYYNIAYGNGKYIISSGSSSYKPLVSSDGITWTLGGAQPNDFWSLAFGAGLFVGVRPLAGKCYTSPDGSSWTARNLASTYIRTNRITWAGDKFIVTGTMGYYIYVSSNGTSWTNYDALNGTDGSFAVCYGDIDADA